MRQRYDNLDAMTFARERMNDFAIELPADDQIDEHLRSLQVAVNEIYRLWANNYRFASEERLRSHLKKITRYQSIKGEYLKEQARRFLSSAQTFVDKGVVQWQV